MTSDQPYTGLNSKDRLDQYQIKGPEGTKTYLVASESHTVFEIVPRDPSKPKVASSHPNSRDNGFEAVKVTDPVIAKGLIKMIFSTPTRKTR
ncbi:MAG TPA: hypothetical protein VHA12_00310 [Candidatus Nanoarchaeia archaeon]|nr:hypothetical protein [Candidatus Nanoarchaeia archaeon]